MERKKLSWWELIGFVNNLSALQDVGVHSTTGAASTPIENLNMVAQAVPRAGDDISVVDQKNRQVLNMLGGMRGSLIGKYDPRAPVGRG